MGDQKRLKFTLLLAMIIGALLIVSTFFFSHFDHVDLLPQGVTILEGKMHEETEAQTRILSITLPDEFDEARSLLFKTTHTQVDVTVGRESMHSHGREGTPSFMKSPGALWHVVDIPPGSAGDTLSIYITAVYEDYYGNDPVIRYGSHDGCVMHLLLSSLPIVLINIIILFVGLVCIVLHNIGWLRKTGPARNSFLFIGLFAVCIAAWSLCQSGFLQLIIPDGAALYLIDFFSFYLFPACFNLFIASICKGKSESLFCIFAALYLLESAVSTALQFAGVADMFEMLRVGHLTMLINTVCIFVFTHREVVREQNEMARKMRVPLYVVMLFALCELVVYYMRDFRETSFFIPLGTIVFIIMLACQLVSLYYQSILEEQKMAYFKKLANTDMLTEVFNRNAYEDRLRSLEQQELELRTTCVVMFDINNMKRINDVYGHEAGDIALKTCCRCILGAFGDTGSCYRIGGDEFVYLCHGGIGVARRAARFEELIRQDAKGLNFPFGVAIGYATYDPKLDGSLRDVIRRSDEMMYLNKEYQKRRSAACDYSTEAPVPVDK